MLPAPNRDELNAPHETLDTPDAAEHSRTTDPAQYRSRSFEGREGSRYWWHKSHPGFVPLIYGCLSDEEWEILADWYRDTDSKNLPGEMTVPMISVLAGFINGSGLKHIVQLGHFAGYSLLLLGFIFRSMGRPRAVYSVDIDASISAYTQSWIDRAGLNDFVKIHVSSSDEPSLPAAARRYFGDGIQAAIIDSSHQYAHTLRELDLWYEALDPLGLIFLHDTSLAAKKYDSTNQGGVRRALDEWVWKTGASCVNINGDYTGPTNVTYYDSCGLGIIAKTPRPAPQNWLRRIFGRWGRPRRT